MKEHFNKNLIMSEEEEHLFQQSNSCWICKKDVLVLANVFERFIRTCLKCYELDPCHYFSSPGLSWDAMYMRH